ncbi:Uncharacterised protein [Moraxella ovis]|nr:Uncharacterised protein [Moraxella ovis]STZ05997.1 Uncharacterised protein [Moraxella ovis]
MKALINAFKVAYPYLFIIVTSSVLTGAMFLSFLWAVGKI